jgi:Flp pilus assembly protein TadD
MLFFLLAIAAYGWYVRRPGVARYLLVAALFAMALMSKPMAITLPFLLLLLDDWPLGRMRMAADANWRDEARLRFASETQSLTTLCLEKLPLLALSAGSAVITMFAQRAGGAVLTSAAHAPLLRLENVIIGYALYIEKAIWPSHLAALYPYPHALPSWEVAASAIVLLAITYAALKYRQRRYLMVGWFWYLGTMVPMIGLVQVGNQAMADRYTYLPLIGFFIMTVWAAAEWASARHFSVKYVATAGLTLLLAFSAVTRIQLGYWHDDLSLWSHALAVTRNNYVAENNFASALVREGRIDEAFVHFQTASALEPSDPTSQLNLGIYAEQHGDLAQAEARYEMALRLATDSQLRATAYANLGTVYFALHDYDRAEQNFDSALKLKGSFSIAFLDLGLIAQKTAQTTGDWSRAADYFAQSVALEPNDVGYLLLASALHHANRIEDANRAYRQALQFSTDLAQSRQRAAQLSAQ